MGEHVHLKISFCKSNAFFAFTAWTECSEKGKIKLSVTMDSSADIIHFLALCIYLFYLNPSRQTDSHSILSLGVDVRKVFYVLDPDANLRNAQDRFKDWFCR